ncbi:MAG: ubiquinone biosynthesis protein UbiH [Acetobacteraceae bacterium]|nr:ubiquinone biosynthesis protein UbiH [Acetobacteraceae bacterium]
MTETILAEICVVGAGPVGATLACRLAAAGMSIVVIDRAPLPPMERPAFDGRAYAIAHASRDIIAAAGIWDRLPKPACPIEEIRVSDGRLGRPASRLFLHFDHRQATQPGETTGNPLGPFGWMVEARDLRVALNTTLHSQPNLRLLAPAAAQVERHADGATVRIAGGPTIHARLVIAAEGKNSPLREQAKIPVTRLPYHQTGIVCAIAHDRPHHNTALEHFLPSGPFARLPMCSTADAPNVSAIVWTERDAIARRVLALNDDAFAHQIARRMGDHLGIVRLLGGRWHFPLAAQHAHRYFDTRLALIGDAAHTIHPIAGQGLNLGFRDVGALAALLIAAHEMGADPGAPGLLARYQRARRPDNLLMLAATDTLDRLFSTGFPPIRLIRDLGLGAVQRLPGLKRLFMRHAMGLGGR